MTDGCCLPQRPSAANCYYNSLAVRVHPPVPTSSVLHESLPLNIRLRVGREFRSRRPLRQKTPVWHYIIINGAQPVSDPSPVLDLAGKVPSYNSDQGLKLELLNGI